MPCRSDRRELRRRLRAAARSKNTAFGGLLAGNLSDLARRRALVAGVRLRDHGSEEIVEFADGTALELDVMECSGVADRMGGQVVPGMRLGQAIPCPGRDWYRLWFSLPHGEAAEVVAKVSSFRAPPAPPSTSPWWWGWPVP